MRRFKCGHVRALQSALRFVLHSCHSCSSGSRQSRAQIAQLFIHILRLLHGLRDFCAQKIAITDSQFVDQAISPTLRESRASSKIFDTKHPGAPPPGNRSTHQTRGAGRELRILPPAAEVHVRPRWPPSAHRKFFPQARSQLPWQRSTNATAPRPSIRPMTQTARRRHVLGSGV